MKVVCIDNIDNNSLTIGSIYDCNGDLSKGIVWVHSDKVAYLTDTNNIITLSEYRNKQINEILE